MYTMLSYVVFEQKLSEIKRERAFGLHHHQFLNPRAPENLMMVFFFYCSLFISDHFCSKTTYH